jgi:prefoldin subunit 5
MTLDEIFNQFFNARLAEIFGPNYKKFRDSFNDLIKTTNQHSQRIDELEATANFLSGNINALDKNNEKYSQEFAKLHPLLKGHGDLIVRLNTRNNELSQTIEKLEINLRRLTGDISAANDKNRELSQKIADLEFKNKSLLFRNNEYESKKPSPSYGFNEKDAKSGKSERSHKEPDNASYMSNSGQPEKTPQNAQTDNGIITKFNAWAANPTGQIPAGFTFLAGDFRIRTKQQLKETAEETKWIINCTAGGKRYLFPNPNSFNQMTDIRELYDMDQNMLKEKGRNKIKIITPCEISASGFIEFPGEIKILP